ncbi:AI-2E family transporter [Candidatus Woesearchaeota archaeon]|nr:AI-2E family transporter [Candidatus Woesearchaeota archaeon]
MILIIIFIGLALFIIWPFLLSIVSAGIIAYIFYPLFLRLKKKVKGNALSAFATTMIIILLILIPFIFMINTLASQALSVYVETNKYIGENKEQVSMIEESVSEKLGVDFKLNQAISDVTTYVVRETRNFLASLPNRILQIFIFLFLLYYFFKDGPKIIDYVKGLIPIDIKNRNTILKRLDELIKAIVFGSLLTALIQGAVGGIGFLAFGVSSPIFWGFMMAVFALIPFVGTAIIWIPASLYLVLAGVTTQNAWLIGKGIGLAVYGFFVISMVDNFLKPYLIGDKGKLHPAIVLLGILGGLAAMGFIGIVVGPMIMIIFLSIIEAYKGELETATKKKKT